jgi:predicted Rdx family selenoprotein
MVKIKANGVMIRKRRKNGTMTKSQDDKEKVRFRRRLDPTKMDVREGEIKDLRWMRNR